MTNKHSLFDEDDFGYEGFEDEYEEEKVVKRCNCGYKGELVPDVNGFRCANCDYLLIDKGRR